MRSWNIDVRKISHNTWNQQHYSGNRENEVMSENMGKKAVKLDSLIMYSVKSHGY